MDKFYRASDFADADRAALADLIESLPEHDFDSLRAFLRHLLDLLENDIDFRIHSAAPKDTL